GFAAAGFVVLGLGRAYLFGGIFHARQVNVESCACSDLALGEHVSIALLVDALAGIGNRDYGVAPGLDETLFAKVLAHGNVGTLQCELAAFGHGIFGIDDQVHDDLLQLAGIGAGVSGLGGEPRHQFDVFADQGPQQALHVADDGVDVDYLEFEELLAAERQQLASEGRGAVGCLLDGLDLLVHGAALFQLLQQDLGVSVNDHQKVVEVVGDAAGEAADGIHFLRLAKLLFELTPVGDIFGDQFQYFFGFIADSGGAAAEPHDDDAPVFASPLHFPPIAASGAAIVLGQPVQLLRIDEDFAPRIQPEKIFDRFMPEHGDERRIH